MKKKFLDAIASPDLGYERKSVSERESLTLFETEGDVQQPPKEKRQ